MFFKPPPTPALPGRPGPGEREEAGGIVARVRAASRGHGSDASNKRVVLYLVGAIAFGAVIYNFFAGSGFRTAPPAASPPPVGTPPPTGVPRADTDAPAEPFRVPISLDDKPEQALRIPEILALVETRGDEALRAQAIERLGILALGTGRGREALEAAAWLLDGAEPPPPESLQHVQKAAFLGLRDDGLAPAAMAVFDRLPDQGGVLVWDVLDEIVRDGGRALAVRVQAARLRPSRGRPADLEALANDPATHPDLRRALAQSEDARR
jgi:hypothetical protein